MAVGTNSGPHLKALEKALAARFGWQTAASWRGDLCSAITRKAARLGLDELAYCRMAVQSPAELEALAELVTNSETRFFREADQFETLRDSIIPELMASRAKERRLDLWCAACSTGEEAYSVAILLNELVPEAAHWKTSLMATDLRGPAIIAASQGRYTASSLGAIETRLRNKYFTTAGNNGRERSFDALPSLRKQVTFRRANVYDSQFWKSINTSFDLIVCNNLLLYFHALAVKQTVERLASVLRRGGVLVVMKNEISYIDHPQLKLDATLPGAFFRKV